MSESTRAPMANDPLPPKRIIEALLFVGNAPLTAERAAEIIRNLAEDQFRGIIDELNREYRQQMRPYTIQSRDGGFVLSLKAGFRDVVERLHGSPREARLTPAARDVLALIAYRQPIHKAEIDSQRGQDSRGPLQQLVRLGLIAVDSRVSGSRDFAYVTTHRFLELIGLRSLDDLPQTGELRKL